MSRIENILVEPADAPARVIVNARTGTVVINGAVRISPAAVSHGRLTVSVEENPARHPARAAARAARPRSSRTATSRSTRSARRMFDFAPGASLSEIVRAVNAIGAAPSDLVAILEALKQAGALRAELVIL